MRVAIYLSHERETNDDDAGSGASHQATRDKNQSTKVGARATTRAHEKQIAGDIDDHTPEHHLADRPLR